MKELLLLGAIFLLPAIFIIIRNFLCDLSFWQKKNYSLEKFSQNILWDLDKDNFSGYLVVFKIISLAFLGLGFESVLSGTIGIFLILLIWSFEAFRRLELIFLTREPKVDISKPRNLISILLFIALLLFIFLQISLPFGIIQAGNNPQNYQFQLDFRIPSAYVYLLMIAATFLLIDLLTSLITSIIQMGINLLTNLRRGIKLALQNHLAENLIDQNRLIVFTGENFHELIQVLKTDLSNLVGIDTNDTSFIKEYLLDHKIRGKIIFINSEFANISKMIQMLRAEALVINGSDFNLLPSLLTIPLRTELILNSDLWNYKEVLENFSGKVTFFGKKLIRLDSKKGRFIWQIKTQLSDKRISAHYVTNVEEFRVSLNTLNLEYAAALPIAIALNDLLKNETSEFLNKIERKFKPKEVFIEGDNETEIISFANKELNYLELRKNIISAKEHAKSNRLILLTNGLGRKKIPQSFFKDIDKYLDIAITNDYALVKELNLNGVKAFYADNFKNFTYLARKHSDKNDIFLIEGHFKEPLLRYLKKNVF